MSMSQIIRTLKKNKRFLISTHVNPDPDALCSQLAIARYLRSMGKKVSILNEGPVPHRLKFLKGIKNVQSFDAGQRLAYDVAILVDCGEVNRIGKVQRLIQKDKVLINIDHHLTNNYFGTLNLVQPYASSTAEVLYELFLKAKCPLTKTMAEHLYIGIMTDTGSFRHENTTAKTHAIAASLMKFNLAVPALYQKLYETISVKDFRELLRAIKNYEVHFKRKVVCIRLKKNVMSRFSTGFDLRDTIFKFFRSIHGVEVIAVFTEIQHRKIRLNFRSSNKFNVAKLASYFHGGGHRRASGCLIENTITTAQRMVLRKIKTLL